MAIGPRLNETVPDPSRWPLIPGPVAQSDKPREQHVSEIRYLLFQICNLALLLLDQEPQHDAPRDSDIEGRG
jgi:hypothetical protein